VLKGKAWNEKKVDHDVTKLVCNIADTALSPEEAARETMTIIREMVGKKVNSSRRHGGV
jgi:ethanolamine ammonia-lyase large subunit